jgi:hypothetical protein
VSSILELVKGSGLIFAGAVLERGRSTVPLLASSPDLVVVRVERALRADAVHGDMKGRLVTVVPASPEGLSPGAEAVFFTNSLIHGQGIAVREVAHVDLSEEAATDRAIADLPREHLSERLSEAALVVEAEVAAVSALERTRSSRHAAEWTAADLKVSKVIHGESTEAARVCFPTSTHPRWASAPRFKARQRGIFFLHEPDREHDHLLADVPAGCLLALDPADFQPVSQLRHIETLVGTAK